MVIVFEVTNVSYKSSVFSNLLYLLLFSQIYFEDLSKFDS